MDLEKIKKLIEFVGSSRVSELSVTQGGVTLRIVRESEGSCSPAHAPQATTTIPPSETDHAASSPPSVAETFQGNIVAATSFGLFHRAPSPGASPFIQLGDQISEGQELFIIEAMKVFSTVRSERSGKVVRILAKDGEDVEFGQPILELE